MDSTAPTSATIQGQPTAKRYLSSQEACDALVLRNGDMSLAAADLNVSTGQMMAALAQDQANVAYLNNMMRTIMLMDAAATFKAGSEFVRTAFEDMKPEDALKGLAALATVIERLSDNHTSTSNLNLTARGSFEHIMREMPPEVRRSLLVLAQSSDSQSMAALDNALSRLAPAGGPGPQQAPVKVGPAGPEYANTTEGTTPRVQVPYTPANGHTHANGMTGHDEGAT